MIYRFTSIMFLGALWLATWWRAATQSLVHDEAFTWQLYLAGPFRMIFEYFDANNHFLAVLLMRLFSGIFGPSEISLRLVSLLAGALYFFAVYRLARRALGDSACMLLAIALMTLNPLVLDFFVAARGYGLALALLAAGIDISHEAVVSGEAAAKRLALAGGCLGLSFCANLVFILPALAVAALAWFSMPRQKPEPAKKGKKAAGRPAPLWLLPAALAAAGLFLLLFSPLARAEGSGFYVGEESLKASLENLARCSLAYNKGIGGLNAETPLNAAWRNVVVLGLAPLAVLLGLWLGRGKPAPAALLLRFLSIATAAPALFLLAAHYTAALLFPADRTGLYFLALAGGLLAAVARELASRKGLLRAAGWGLTAAAVLIAAQYAIQFETRSFLVWSYDADTRDLLERARTLVKAPARAAVSWHYEPTANYYRVTRKWDWLEPVRRDSLETGGDFYIFLPQELSRAKELGLKVVALGPISGTVLAVK